MSIIWEDGKEDFYFSKAGKNRIEGLEHLKRVYKEDTGEELKKPQD